MSELIIFVLGCVVTAIATLAVFMVGRGEGEDLTEDGTAFRPLSEGADQPPASLGRPVAGESGG